MERCPWQLVALVVAVVARAVLGQDCLRSSGEIGRCLNIRFCPELNQLLLQALRSPEPAIIKELRESVCQIENNVPKVCCKRRRSTAGLSGNSLLPKDCGRTVLADRIVKGANASLFAWPWMALLRGSNQRGSLWVCGGVLISNRYVLTAAHCVHESSLFKLEFVRLGEYQLSSDSDCERRVCAPPPQDIQVEEIIVHEEYSKVRRCPRCHDIALLRLATPAQLHPAHVVPVCLPKNLEQELGVPRNNLTGQYGWAAGWGTIDAARTVPADILQEALLPIGRAFCDTSSYPDPEMVVCAGGEGADSCGGDSGGPLLMESFGSKRSYVVGVVSSGPSVCGAPQTQGIYTNVYYYMPWILTHLRP